MITERLKSIDIFRGLCMSWMILGHLFDWWIQTDYSWPRRIMTIILEPIGASGFLFISGISISISYKKRIYKAKNSDVYSYRMIRNSYLFRILFIFLTAIIYNSTIAIRLAEPQMIWTWFVLLTTSISLLIAWPLLKTSIQFRILWGFFIIIINQYIVSLLIPYDGYSNIYGLLFHFLYNDINQDPILFFFPFFLIGTVVGDTIYTVFYIKNEKKTSSKRFFFVTLITCGAGLIFFGAMFEMPQYLTRSSFSWIIYSLGFDLSLIAILLVFEEMKIFRTKKSYKFLFYYSYYSLTIYLAHNILYLLFLNQLNEFNIWFFILAAFVLIGLILRAVYKKWESLASLKAQIGKLSLILATKIEMRIRFKQIENLGVN